MKLVQRNFHLIFVVLLSCIVSCYANELPDFTKLVEKHESAVVNISTTRLAKQPKQDIQRRFAPHDTDPFEELLRRFFGEEEYHGGPQQREAKSLGSGFIISNDGYIVTNNHVIRDADEVLVRLSDNQEYEAKIIGVDEGTDLALLKIKEADMPFLKFGSSADLKVGEWVLAIGSPFGFEHSVAAGIVSAKGRGLRSEQYVPFIQTDVAINPGNSGGPLLNLAGEVIGINAQIVSKTGGSLGISFSIPSDVAQGVIKQLKNNGYVRRGWLGVAFQPMDRKLAKSFGVETTSGALVAQVITGSPADKAGILQGDIISKFNSKKISDATSLAPLVGGIEPGKKVNLTIIRSKKEKVINVTIGEVERKESRKAESESSDSVDNILGVSVRLMTDAELAKSEAKQRGVVIKEINNDSILRRLGMRSGDVLYSINTHETETVKDFNNIVKLLKKGQTISVLIGRGKGRMFHALELR